MEGVSVKNNLDFTAWLEEELGDVTERQFTSAYYQEEEEAETTVDVGSE